MTDKSRVARLLATSLIAGAGLCATAQPVFAAGFYIQEQSARGAGRAYSGEIADTGPDSLWWNPAAIGGMTGGEASFNATAILPRATVTDTGTLIVRPGQSVAAVGGNSTTRNPIDNGVVPQGAIAHALTNQLAVGLAISAPYNFTTTYASDSFARYSALTTRLRTFDIQPSLAVHFDAPHGVGVNFGAAVNIERTTATFGTASCSVSLASAFFSPTRSTNVMTAPIASSVRNAATTQSARPDFFSGAELWRVIPGWTVRVSVLSGASTT